MDELVFFHSHDIFENIHAAAQAKVLHKIIQFGEKIAVDCGYRLYAEKCFTRNFDP